jgi:hypothetical protein
MIQRDLVWQGRNETCQIRSLRPAVFKIPSPLSPLPLLNLPTVGMLHRANPKAKQGCIASWEGIPLFSQFSMHINIPCVLLLGVFKAMRRWSCFGLGFAGGCSSSSRRLGVGGVGCFRAGGAESSEDFGVISISFGFLSVTCTACQILLDRSFVSVCTYFVLRLLLV